MIAISQRCDTLSCIEQKKSDTGSQSKSMKKITPQQAEYHEGNTTESLIKASGTPSAGAASQLSADMTKTATLF